MGATGSNVEIERKFLVRGPWPSAAQVQSIEQIYINPGAAVSVRLRQCDGHYTLTLKKGRSAMVRSEYNLPVDADQARSMMAEFEVGGRIHKQRHLVAGGWEVDVFAGANQGLIVAEIELEHERQTFTRPDWLAREVTNDPRFTNHALFLHPFSRWGLSYADLLVRG